MIALQRQLSLVASEKDDKDVIENSGLTMSGDASPSSHQLRKRTVASLGSIKSIDDRAAAAETKPLMSNQLIKEEDIEVGAVCYMSRSVTVITDSYSVPKSVLI